MSGKTDKCALCRRECIPTFEHIPPRAAFNSHPSRPVTGDKLIKDRERMPWDVEGLPYENQQRGMGRYSLCKECNNNTGSWYGNDYARFAHIVHSILTDSKIDTAQAVGIKHIYPLRIIKQVLSMFCSINNFEDERMEPLRSFVLNKDKTGIDQQKYRVSMYFTQSNLIKYAPISVLLHKTPSGIKSTTVSEITAYPLGFILYFDPPDTNNLEGIDITAFSQYNYDDEYAVGFPLCIKEVNNIFPLDYRTKGQITNCIKENRFKLSNIDSAGDCARDKDDSRRDHE